MVFFIWKPLQTFSLQIKFLKLRETCSISSTSCLRVSTVLVLFKLTIHCFLNRRTKTSGKLTFGRGETTLSWGETTVIQHVARGKLCGSPFFPFLSWLFEWFVFTNPYQVHCRSFSRKLTAFTTTSLLDEWTLHEYLHNKNTTFLEVLFCNSAFNCMFQQIHNNCKINSLKVDLKSCTYCTSN